MNLEQNPGYDRRDRRDSGPGFGTGLLVGGGLGLMAGKAECKQRLMYLKAWGFRFGRLQKNHNGYIILIRFLVNNNLRQ